MKSIFGGILLLAGIVGLVYGGLDLTKGSVARDSIVYMILGGIFFAAGVSLIRTTRE
ncbi:MAG: hypothetical protein LH606_12175 [Cytophagaceae bacterium]|nr:hypothetical protein [Cytophagaceae bacterium]